MKEIFELSKIENIAKEIIKKIVLDKKEVATIVTFSGDLGAGKTTLTKEIAKQLGVVDNVISPTFVIMKIYKLNHKKFKNLIHIDAYRLDNYKELINLGWNKIITNKDNLIIIEWPERVSDCLPKNIYNLSLGHKDESTRTIKFWYN